MDQTKVKIQLNNNINTNNEKRENTTQTNQKCSELTKILIAFAILIVLIVFILILLFVIIKVQDNDDDDEDEQIPVIFDVDEGADDMIAYTVANNSRKYNILGITTISQHYYIEDVGKIWLRFLEHMNFDNKVYLGENNPLARTVEKNPFSHNYGFEFPSINKTYEKKGAVDFMYETIKNNKKKVTIFALGPLTNLARLYQRDNTIIENIDEIIIMGGAKYEGNVNENPDAEWNIFNDAEAANVVFHCGIQIQVIGQETKMDFDDDFYQKLLDINTKSSIFAYNAGKGTFQNWNDNWVYDPIVVLYHMNKKIIEMEDYYTEVNTTGFGTNETDYGTMYFWPAEINIKPNIKYAEKINLDLCYKDFEYYLRMY